MHNNLPQTFVTFLNTILAIETETDKWRSQIFFQHPEDIIKCLKQQQQSSNQNPMNQQQPESKQEKLSLKYIINFVQNNSQQPQFQSLNDQNQKVLAKYFNFQNSFTCPVSQFISKLKPINNKCIIDMQKCQTQIKTSLINLFESILKGYKIIKQKRFQCALHYDQIANYFKFHLNSDCLSKQSLKQFMYESNIYGRINFNYLKQYIFGGVEDQIQWSTLFKKIVNVIPDQIKELSQENIVSEQQITEGNANKIFTHNNKYEHRQQTLNQQPQHIRSINKFQEKNKNKQQQDQSCHNQKSLLLQSVSQIKIISQPVSRKQITSPKHSIYSKQIQTPKMISRTQQPQTPKSKNTPNSDYSNVLNEINNLQELLSKTKQKYQKNREQLQNQTKEIRLNQTKRMEKIGKLTNRPVADYSNLKINTQTAQFKQSQVSNQRTTEQNLSNCKSSILSPSQNRKIQQSKLNYHKKYDYYYQSQPQQKSNNKNSQEQKMIQSHVKPFISRQTMKKQIEQTLQQTTQSKTSHRNNKQPKQPTSFIQSDVEKRQAGKIKRRSVSKDKQQMVSPNRQFLVENPHLIYTQNQSTKQALTLNPKPHHQQQYKQYQAVLKQIKREQLRYNKLVEEGQSYIKEKQINKKLSLNSDLDVYEQPINYKRYYCPLSNKFTSQEMLFKAKRTDSLAATPQGSKFSNIMKQIEQNTLSRSRISSKKRQQIVHKATSEAKLRIQQIQNRALSRLAKLDTQSHQIQQKLRKRQSFSSIIMNTPNDKNTIKLNESKQHKIGQNTKIKGSIQPSQNKRKLIINDMLNERPSTIKLYSKVSNIRKN